MLKRIVITLFLFISLTPKAVFAASVPASPGQIFQVTPIILNAPLVPGKQGTFSIQVKNLLPTSLGIHATIEDFRPEGEDDLIRTETKQDPIIPWSTIPNSDMVMSPGETKSLTLQVSPSQAAKNGNYYELVFLTPFFDQLKTSTSPIVLSRIGVLVSGTIGTPSYSNLKAESAITKLEMTKTKSQNMYALTAHVQNNAAYQFDAKPLLIFTPLFGNPQVFQIQDKHVLPHTTRRFSTIVVTPNRFLYKLQARISVGNGEQIQKSEWIWLLPFSGWHIAVGATISLVIVSLTFARKRLIKAMRILLGKSL